MTTTLPAESIDIIVFIIGDVRYGADASQVLRIDRAGHQAKLSDALGMPQSGERALVFNDPDGELHLCVDRVEGVRPAPVQELRRVPLAAGRTRAVLGLWLERGETPLVLIDLLNSLDAPGGA